MRLQLEGAVRRDSGFTLSANLDVEAQGVIALVGKSGAGKSTLLRAIAGFETGSDLSVRVDGESWDALPAHLRPVSTVFQEPRLFPHLDVAQNLSFARAHGNGNGVRLALEEVIEFLDLEPLLAQRPAALSGGQQQRVAIGRALLSPAKLWLFDEPLSALDPAARREIAPYLGDLCRTHRVPIVYVTHSLPDILHLADRVLVADAGKITSIDSLSEFSTSFSNPLLQDDEAGAIVACTFVRYDARYGLSELRLGTTPLWVRGDLSSYEGDIKLHIPARDVSLAIEPIGRASILNRVPCVIDATEHEHGSVIVRLRCENQFLLARVTEMSAHDLGLVKGKEVQALVKSVALRNPR